VQTCMWQASEPRVYLNSVEQVTACSRDVQRAEYLLKTYYSRRLFSWIGGAHAPAGAGGWRRLAGCVIVRVHHCHAITTCTCTRQGCICQLPVVNNDHMNCALDTAAIAVVPGLCGTHRPQISPAHAADSPVTWLTSANNICTPS